MSSSSGPTQDIDVHRSVTERFGSTLASSPIRPRRSSRKSAAASLVVELVFAQLIWLPLEAHEHHRLLPAHPEEARAGSWRTSTSTSCSLTPRARQGDLDGLFDARPLA
jgi:hypothetical protein